MQLTPHALKNSRKRTRKSHTPYSDTPSHVKEFKDCSCAPSCSIMHTHKNKNIRSADVCLQNPPNSVPTNCKLSPSNGIWREKSHRVALRDKSTTNECSQKNMAFLNRLNTPPDAKNALSPNDRRGEKTTALVFCVAYLHALVSWPPVWLVRCFFEHCGWCVIIWELFHRDLHRPLQSAR